MPKIQLVLVDQNLDYIEQFHRFVRETNYRDSIYLKSFTNTEGLLSYFKSDRSTDFYLIDEKCFPLEVDPARFIVLTENYLKNDTQLPTIFKYQALNIIISQALDLHEKNKPPTQIKHQTKLFSVFSTTGHIGKTTFGLNLAKELALTNKVFYLDLQLLNSSALFFPSPPSDDFTKVLYYVKVNPEYLSNKLNDFIRTDKDTGIDYFGAKNIKFVDYEDLKVEELYLLLDILKKSGNYHYIIIDLDSNVNQLVLDTLLVSDQLFWLVINDKQYMYKTRLLFKQMEEDRADLLDLIKNRTSFILNKAIHPSQKMELIDFNVVGSLPYIPKWKQYNDPEYLLYEEDYIKAVKAIKASTL